MKTSSLALVASLVLPSCTTTTTDPAKVEQTKAGETKAGDAKAGDAKAKTGEKPEKTRRPRGKQIPAPADVANPPADANKTESGIVHKTLTPGEGESPGDDDSVKIQLTAWTSDGATIETTDGRKTPKLVRMGRPPVPGLGEAIKLMKVGEKARFWIPPELTYKGRKGAPEGTLCYEITLEEVLRAPPTPEDVAAPPADAIKTKSGLAYKVLEPSKCEAELAAAAEAKPDPEDVAEAKAAEAAKPEAAKPTKVCGVKPDPWDRVRVDYTGWTTDGKMFDSSVTRGRPSTFPVNRVVPGWTEGLQLMVVGDKTRLWVPEELAYKGAPGKPAGMLVFDVELHEIDEQPEPPPPPEVPEDVAEPPADATKTESGLAYKVIQPGTGKVKPTEDSVVEVHYSGWTTDGKMFDSSVTRGKTTSFPLKRVIPGWTEGLQLMVEGEKTRFWIPVDLAYKNQPGKPAGMLVFDVELIKIDPPKKGPGSVHGHP
ncbi:MAG: FKBP-type peptidyl-prolyl cis-trans isomerase [Myxococcota bacterium]